MLYLAAIPVVLLALWGFVDIIRLIERTFLSRRAKQINIVIIPLTGHVENLEQIVRSAISEQTWSKTESTEIILLDNGLDEETRKLCRILCAEGSVALCNPHSVCSVLAERIVFAK